MDLSHLADYIITHNFVGCILKVNFLVMLFCREFAGKHFEYEFCNVNCYNVLPLVFLSSIVDVIFVLFYLVHISYFSIVN